MVICITAEDFDLEKNQCDGLAISIVSMNGLTKCSNHLTSVKRSNRLKDVRTFTYVVYEKRYGSINHTRLLFVLHQM